MEHCRTKDILCVTNVLGRKNASVYMRLVGFEPDGYTSKAAGIAEEGCGLVEAGFEYVCSTPEKLMIFKKRK